MKKNLGHKNVGAEYVTGKINSILRSFILDDFTVWLLLRLKNLNMTESDKAFSKRPQKIF